MITSKRIRIAIILAAITSGMILITTARSVSIEVIAPVADSYADPIQAIKNVAIEKGIRPDDLLAISAQESSLGKAKSGDHGCSLGWFHINTCANVGTSEVIGDPAREARWVSDRLISYGYLEGKRTLAFARYNSPAYPNYEYAKQVEKRLAELPLFLKPYKEAGKVIGPR